jgi:uncharacterized membrane protein
VLGDACEAGAMSEKNGAGIGFIIVVFLLAAVGLWVVWGLLGFLFAAFKGLLSLVLIGLVLYGVYRVGKKFDRS